MQSHCTSRPRAGTWAAGLIGVLGVAAPAAAEDARAPVTLAYIVELARTSAIESRLASLDVDDARARLAGAQALISANPSVSGSAGPRLGDPLTVDAQAAVGVPVELGFRRGRAVELAQHEVRRERFRLKGAQRRAVLDAVSTYLHALHAAELLVLAKERRSIAEQLVSTAVEREQAGDASRFEVNLARAELARSTSQVLDKESLVQTRLAELARLVAIKLDAQLKLDGTLTDHASPERVRAALGFDDVPELNEVAAETDAALAAVALAETAAWPEVSVIGSYTLDNGEQVASAGLSITLPVFSTGEGERRSAAVRVERSRLLAEATRSRVELDRGRAQLTLRTATDAARVLAGEGLPRAIENESLAREAYRAGKLDLATYVVLRRDSLETRQEHLDRLLEQGLAALAVASLEVLAEQRAAAAAERDGGR